MTKTEYEALTVAQLKEMADTQGISIPSDARKADIIEALLAAEGQPNEEPEPAPADPAPVDDQEMREQQVSSTETALMTDTHFLLVKLLS
jgi:hypothetical protein